VLHHGALLSESATTHAGVRRGIVVRITCVEASAPHLPVPGLHFFPVAYDACNTCGRRRIPHRLPPLRVRLRLRPTPAERDRDELVVASVAARAGPVESSLAPSPTADPSDRPPGGAPIYMVLLPRRARVARGHCTNRDWSKAPEREGKEGKKKTPELF